MKIVKMKYVLLIILSFLMGISLSYKIFYSPCKETVIATSCGKNTLDEFRLEIRIPEFKIENI